MTQPDLEMLSYEEAYAALEDVVARLESGTLSLEDSVLMYQRGRALTKRCQQLLEDAELRIQQVDDDGNLSDLNL